MKKLTNKITTMLSLLCFVMMSYNANATLLSFTTDKLTYEQADTVLVDVFVNNINSEAAEFGFDLGFNDLALSYEGFTFDDSVFFSAVIADASLFASNAVTFFNAWFDSADVPAASFKLGQLRFSALSATTPSFNVSNLYLADSNFNEVSAHNSVQVPLPNSALLILIALAMFSLRKKHLSLENT
jgi:hypothetical protein